MSLIKNDILGPSLINLARLSTLNPPIANPQIQVHINTFISGHRHRQLLHSLKPHTASFSSPDAGRQSFPK
ncbi:unnamed protein product [Lactuca saligna]|uniref:Uncharacterized protein n=1 Tax=Lactuca saligna TaxID=75948 RepID=A0AA36A3H7_LACSI|nr:unnamed protein product [Lactuca saligna]